MSRVITLNTLARDENRRLVESIAIEQGRLAAEYNTNLREAFLNDPNFTREVLDNIYLISIERGGSIEREDYEKEYCEEAFRHFRNGYDNSKKIDCNEEVSDGGKKLDDNKELSDNSNNNLEGNNNLENLSVSDLLSIFESNSSRNVSLLNQMILSSELTRTNPNIPNESIHDIIDTRQILGSNVFTAITPVPLNPVIPINTNINSSDLIQPTFTVNSVETSTVLSSEPIIPNSTEPTVLRSTTPTVPSSNEAALISSTEPIIPSSTEPEIVGTTTPIILNSTEPTILNSTEPSTLNSTIINEVEFTPNSTLPASFSRASVQQCAEQMKFLHSKIADLIKTNQIQQAVMDIAASEIDLEQLNQSNETMVQVGNSLSNSGVTDEIANRQTLSEYMSSFIGSFKNTFQNAIIITSVGALGAAFTYTLFYSNSFDTIRDIATNTFFHSNSIQPVVTESSELPSNTSGTPMIFNGSINFFNGPSSINNSTLSETVSSDSLLDEASRTASSAAANNSMGSVLALNSDNSLLSPTNVVSYVAAVITAGVTVVGTVLTKRGLSNFGKIGKFFRKKK